MALSLAFSVGSRTAVKVYENLLKDSRFDVPFNEMMKSSVLDDKTRERLSAVSKDDIFKIFKCCKDNGIKILTMYSSKYPDRLRNIPSPPLILYIKGNFPEVDSEPMFCIVGPRKVTKFGRKAAFSLARRLSKSGMIIVGGNADGADTAVHEGTFSADGMSVMVVVDGIVTVLNSGRRKLCEKVLKNGCIISESPPMFLAPKYCFRLRNRLMSGLSIGVAVVEAPKISGGLITANHAIEQNRDVFVIPGSPSDKAYEGSNALLRDGATPLLEAKDIFLRYITEFPEKISIENAYKSSSAQKSPKKSLSVLSNEAVLVYNNLVKPEFTVDDINLPDIDPTVLISALTELEMEHLIKSSPGGNYKISNQSKEF